MPRIFISHIHEDKLAAIHLVSFLRTKLRVPPEDLFLSSNRQIQLGSEWLATINATFRACTVIIALFSPEALRRPWVHFEAGGAFFSKGKLLIPVCIGGQNPCDLGRPYSNIQAADLHEWTSSHYLVTSIWKKLRPETLGLPELEYAEDDPDVRKLMAGLEEYRNERMHLPSSSPNRLN